MLLKFGKAYMECDLQYDLVYLFYHTAELLKINVT